MTLNDIRALVVSCDPNAGHYESAGTKGSYTVWREVHRLHTMADGEHMEGWAFQIDRFARGENDQVAAAIYAALESDDRVAFEYLIDYERDTRIVHHIFDCEGY